MFSVLVLLEDSENVWSDRLRQKMANPAAKIRFFHFRHAVTNHILGGATHQLLHLSIIFHWNEAKHQQGSKASVQRATVTYRQNLKIHILSLLATVARLLQPSQMSS